MLYQKGPDSIDVLNIILFIIIIAFIISSNVIYINIPLIKSIQNMKQILIH